MKQLIKNYTKLMILISLIFFMMAANASPLKLEYTITDVGGQYQYDFTLTLDNHDGSWEPGQEFEWFIIGVEQTTQSGPPAGNGFGLFDNFEFISVPTGFMADNTGGGVNGPTLAFGSTADFPGYVPTAIGDSIKFSGIANNILAQGELIWSHHTLSSSGQTITYEVAKLNAATKPPIPDLAASITKLGVKDKKGQMEFKFEGSALNIGAEQFPAGAIAKAWISADPILDRITDFLVGEWDIESLPMGTTQDFKLKEVLSDPLSGLYFIFYVDASSSVGELDENNNMVIKRIP